MSEWQGLGDTGGGGGGKGIQVPDPPAWDSLQRGFIGGHCVCAPTIKM